MESESIAQLLAEFIATVTPERGWTPEDRAEFAQELERVFTAPLTEEELAKADLLLAEMDRLAEERMHSPGVSYVIFRSPKAGD